MTREYIVYRLHYSGLEGVEPVRGTPTATVERMQSALRRHGVADGITWQVHVGDVVSALIQTTKLGGEA